MSEPSTATQAARWSVNLFEAFWSNPDPALVGPVLAEDVIGHWAGLEEPVRGRESYISKLGPFELTGFDRVRAPEGLVVENVIVFDTAAFERRAGIDVPWAAGVVGAPA